MMVKLTTSGRVDLMAGGPVGLVVVLVVGLIDQ